jgi:O-antigen ligase
VLLIVQRPSAWVAGLVILAVPVQPYVTTVAGEPVSVLFVACVLATTVATLEGGVAAAPRIKSSALVAVTPWIGLLLVLPTVLGHGEMHELLYLGMFVDIAWICTRVASLYPEGRLLVVLVFLGSAGVQSLFALVEYVTGRSIDLYGGAGNATYSAQSYFFTYGSSIRTTGTFFDPISLGNVLAMAFPLAVLVLLRRGLRPSYRWFGGAMALLIIAGLIVSLSRASWLGAIAGVLCMAAFSSGEQRRRALALSLSLIIGGLAVATIFYGPLITQRFDSILHPTASTVSTANGDRAREQLWKISWATFESDPVTGVGFGNLVGHIEAVLPGANSSTNASNTYLQYLAEGGVFGGAALVLFIGGMGVDLCRSKDIDWLYPALLGSSVSVAVTWVTDYTVRYYAVAGCLAVVVGLVASSSYRPVPDIVEGTSRRVLRAAVR